jgi:phytanoyl-CoA hydroxylase
MLTDQQLAGYRERGMLVVPDVLGIGEVAALREQVDGWVEESREHATGDELFDLEPTHSRGAPAVRRIKDPAAVSALFRRLVAHPRIVDVVTSLIGSDVLWRSTKLNMKSAGVGSPVEWHQDWAFYPHTNDDLLAVGVPLDDMDLDNGCLLGIAGSHRGPVLDHHANGVFVGAVDPSCISAAEIEPIPAPAGAITVHHVRLLHGSAPNLSGRPRRLFLAEYAAADAWPLMGDDWEGRKARTVSGSPTLSPRMESVPIRIPLPVPRPGEKQTIYELQEAQQDRRFAFEETHHVSPAAAN